MRMGGFRLPFFIGRDRDNRISAVTMQNKDRCEVASIDAYAINPGERGIRSESTPIRNRARHRIQNFEVSPG